MEDDRSISPASSISSHDEQELNINMPDIRTQIPTFKYVFD